MLLSDTMMISNVTFNYSGSKTIRPAIDNVSFTIQPGQLVVIVGANGSGKTSMVKLLTRMHEPTTGEILVDGQPASSFRLRDLRESTATLSQDHNLFDGFSVHGNVALGRYTRIEDTDLVENALNLGGASEIVGKMKNQGATVLVPLTTKSFMYSTKREVTDLYEELEKPGDVSGEGWSMSTCVPLLTSGHDRRRKATTRRVSLLDSCHAGRLTQEMN
jgi:ABC-type sugar transport system ATPase subunit